MCAAAGLFPPAIKAIELPDRYIRSPFEGLNTPKAAFASHQHLFFFATALSQAFNTCLFRHGTFARFQHVFFFATALSQAVEALQRGKKKFFRPVYII
jgi:hypothetical protein